MRGTRAADSPSVETNAAEPLFDAQSEAFEMAEAAGPVQDPLKLYVRAIGDGRLLTAVEERELARLKDEGDEGTDDETPVDHSVWNEISEWRYYGEES